MIPGTQGEPYTSSTVKSGEEKERETAWQMSMDV
jgi:hypothetical protein